MSVLDDSARRSPAPPTPPEPVKSTAGAWWLAGGMLVLAVLLAVGWGVHRKGRSAQAAPLRLQVETRGSFLVVNWNRDHPAVKASRSGKLSVWDGDFPKQEMTLDSGQIRGGDLVYATVSDRVQFQLEVDGDRQATESVLAILKGRAPAMETNAQPPAAEPKAAKSLPALPQRQPEPVSAEAAPPPAEPPAAPRQVRAFVPPSPGSAAPQPARTVYLDPPAVQGITPPAVSSALAAPQAPPMPAPPPPAPAPVRSTFVPPRGIRQAQPMVAAQVLRTMITRDTQVEVTAYVDANGKVTRAVASSGDARSYLTSVSIEAARRWVFEPARLDGKPVSGEAKIVFLFRTPQTGAGR